MRYKEWLKTLGFYIEDYSTSKGRWLSNILYALNVLFIGLYVISTYEITQRWARFIIVAEVFIALVFLFELLVRVYVADNMIEELTSFFTIVDILAITPVLLYPISLGYSIDFLRVFYALRAIRFLRITIENQRFFGITVDESRIGQIRIIMTIFLIFFVTAGVFYEIEHILNPDIGNFGNALYFSIVAISTTGFGDITPVTSMGRAVTMIGLLLAITLIPIQIAKARSLTSIDGSKECSRCGQSGHAEDARYCKYCGEKLPCIKSKS